MSEIQQHAEMTFVFANNDVGGKSVVNALQLAEMLGDERRLAPADLHGAIPSSARGFPRRPSNAERPVLQLRAGAAGSGVESVFISR